MTLFLTSSPCDDNVPEGCELPCIYFERNGFVANLQRYVAPGGRLLVIAAWPDAHVRNDEMAATFAGCFAWHGMGFSAVNVLDSRNQDRAPQLIAQSDVIMLAGGLRLFEDVTYPDSVGHPLYVLLDGSYILESEGKSTLYGEAYLLHNGVMELICREGESITLN